MNLLLMSNGLAPGFSYLEHAAPALGDLLAGLDRVAFVPYAQRLLDHHTATVAAAMESFEVEVVGVHVGRSPRKVVESSQAIFVGGGNAFRLCAALYEYDLMGAIRTAVRDGVPYIGSSAGTNVACPSIRTTNDMPIAEPPSFRGLGLIPFQINAHYPKSEVMGNHLGETRDRRIAEFLEQNDVPVLGLCAGAWLAVREGSATVGGLNGARLFQRGARSIELRTNDDLSYLMAVGGTFDAPLPPTGDIDPRPDPPLAKAADPFQ